MVDDSMVNQGRCARDKFGIGGAGGAVGVEEWVVMGVRDSAQSFSQQQGNRAAQAVAADDNTLTDVISRKVIQNKVKRGLESLVKTSVSFTCAFEERDLMSICVA
ncbi:hypothetical protein [Pseudomonas sp. 34 E 7]|nr:hypothetical protein [Pseudomonas sp. 34 E 7]